MTNRRRCLLGTTWKQIKDLTWTIGSQITSTGSRVEASNSAYSSAVMKSGVTVKRTGSQTDGDGVNIACFVHEYKGSGGAAQTNWLRRTSIPVGYTVTLGSDCTNFRFNFAYASNSGKTMTQEIIDSYFSAEYK